MIVLTLNTDTSEVIQRGEQDPAVIEQIRNLIRQGGGAVPGHPHWEFQCTSSLDEGSFCILLPDQTPGMSGMVCGTAGQAQATWSTLERLYLRAADETAAIGWGWLMAAWPSMPTESPWVGVVILPHFFKVINRDRKWLWFFEHAQAWAMMAEVTEEL